MRGVLEEVYQVGLRLLLPQGLEDIYAYIVEEAKKLVKADHGSIFLYQNGKLNRVYTTFPDLRQVVIRSKGFTYQAFRKRKSFIIDFRRQKNINPQIKGLGINSDLLVPLIYRNKSIGVLSLLSTKSGHFEDQHMDILRLFASMANLAIQKEQAYEELKKSLKDRDLFISMAAHELRTPLTTISGYIQLLYSKLAGANSLESRWIEELSGEAYRLTKLVNELMEVNRIKTGQLRYTWKECSLKAIVERAIRDFRFTHPEHKVVLQDKIGNGQDRVIGDHDKLLQVVINLLDNAAKFSSPNTEVVITLKFKSPYLILEVRDQGKGIPKKYLADIFERFYKGAEVEKEGMGLGLFLVKNIIKQHHGDIHIYSAVNKGTKVRIKLHGAKV